MMVWQHILILLLLKLQLLTFHLSSALSACQGLKEKFSVADLFVAIAFKQEHKLGTTIDRLKKNYIFLVIKTVYFKSIWLF